MKKNIKEKILRVIGQVIYDKKGFNILAIDVRGISSITDYVLIAEGNVERHVQSLADDIVDELEENGESPYRIEGTDIGNWIVIDCVDIMIHLFTPIQRDKYQLANLWHDGKLVDLEIDINHNQQDVPLK